MKMFPFFLFGFVLFADVTLEQTQFNPCNPKIRLCD